LWIKVLIRSSQGEIKTNNRAETILSQTRVPSISFIRCGYFMENWSSCVETLKAPEPFFYSTIAPADWKVPMVAVRDVGAVIAREAVSGMKTSSEAPYIYELHGPRKYTPADVEAALVKITAGDVKMEVIEKEKLGEFFGSVLPPNIASDYEEMTVAMLPGGKMILEPDPVEREVVRGKVELEEALREMVKTPG
jgi:uncharacterized protein YbjT (DUF2867 family)